MSDETTRAQLVAWLKCRSVGESFTKEDSEGLDVLLEDAAAHAETETP